MVSIIVAVAQNGVIGGNNQLLWHISEDLRNFKRITSGHPVIMGRKTYESLGRPLPNRTNVVITRQDIQIEGCEVVHSLEEAIAMFPDKDEEVFIIGGAEIYAQALPLADRFYLTHVGRDYEGDTLFPEWSREDWKILSSDHFERGEKFEYPFTIEEYTRRPNHSIKSATRQDIPLIMELAEQSFRPTYQNIVPPEQIDFMMDWMYSERSLNQQFDEGHRFYIIFDEASQPKGYGSIEQQEPQLFHLQRLYLNPETQGKGYGRVLFNHLLSEAKRYAKDNKCRVELNVNRENKATKFYFSMGMQVLYSEDFKIEGTPYLRTDHIMYIDL